MNGSSSNDARSHKAGTETDVRSSEQEHETLYAVLGLLDGGVTLLRAPEGVPTLLAHQLTQIRYELNALPPEVKQGLVASIEDAGARYEGSILIGVQGTSGTLVEHAVNALRDAVLAGELLLGRERALQIDTGVTSARLCDILELLSGKYVPGPTPEESHEDLLLKEFRLTRLPPEAKKASDSIALAQALEQRIGGLRALHIASVERRLNLYAAEFVEEGSDRSVLAKAMKSLLERNGLRVVCEKCPGSASSLTILRGSLYWSHRDSKGERRTHGAMKAVGARRLRVVDPHSLSS